jgi:23S rRNA G2069 N7-methylase RlmK/C1962 C5-methylase RlmI
MRHLARRSSLPRASHKYRRLNSLALGVVRSGGLLMTCSCSGAMTQSGGLAKVVTDAAAEAERQVGFDKMPAGTWLR